MVYRIPRHLAACDLLSAPVRLIEAMPELRVFNLSWNKITALEPASASIKSNIQVLYVLKEELWALATVAYTGCVLIGNVHRAGTSMAIG